MSRSQSQFFKRVGRDQLSGKLRTVRLGKLMGLELEAIRIKVGQIQSGLS